MAATEAVMSKPPRLTRRLIIISALLAALLWRALVPAGFMPAADGSAQLMPCPEGMPGMMVEQPADAANYGTDPGGDPGAQPRDHTDHCPFGSAPFAAPLPAFVLPAPPRTGSRPPTLRFSPRRPEVRVARTHQPRAPPLSA